MPIVGLASSAFRKPHVWAKSGTLMRYKRQFGPEIGNRRRGKIRRDGEEKKFYGFKVKGETTTVEWERVVYIPV